MKNCTIICYGDSNTYGYDPRIGSSGRFDKSIRWTGLLSGQMNVRIENHGICGRCIPHTEAQIDFACKQLSDWQKPGDSVWMWIMLGTNDLLQEDSFTAEYAAIRMEFFLRQLMKESAVSSNNIQLLLIAPARMQQGSWVNEDRLIQESEKIGAYYQKVAQKLSLPFIDAGKWDIPVLFDGVHFSEEGHYNFARSVLHCIRTMPDTTRLSE